MRKSFAAPIVFASAFMCAGVAARAQTPEQRVTVTVVTPTRPPEERVADEFKEKALRKAAEERVAAEESAKAAESGPRALLRRARTLYVSSGTSFFEPVQLQNALRKRDEFELWQLVMLDGYDKRNVADVLVEIDRPLFTYTFTYKLTHRATGVLLAAGKVTAFDGNAAAPTLAARIIAELKKARGEAAAKD